VTESKERKGQARPGPLYKRLYKVLGGYEENFKTQLNKKPAGERKAAFSFFMRTMHKHRRFVEFLSFMKSLSDYVAKALEDRGQEEPTKDRRSSVDVEVFADSWNEASEAIGQFNAYLLKNPDPIGSEDQKAKLLKAATDNILSVAKRSRDPSQARQVEDLVIELINSPYMKKAISKVTGVSKKEEEGDYTLQDFKNKADNYVGDTNAFRRFLGLVITDLRVDNEQLKADKENVEEQIAKKIKPLIREMLRRNK